MTPSGRTFIDLGSVAGPQAILVQDAPPLSATTGYPVQFIRGDSLDVTVRSGGVSIGSDLTVAASVVLALYVYDDAHVLLDALCTLDTSSTIIQTGGKLHAQCASGSPPNVTYTMHGGVSLFYTDMLSLDLRGGSLTHGGGVITTAVVHAGASLSEENIAVTITNLTLYRGSTFRHPRNLITLTNGIDFSGCKPTEVTWDAPAHKTWTPTAI